MQATGQTVRAPDATVERFVRVRETSEFLVRDLAAEDCVVQSMPDVSPTKWHLAHVTWFFETFLLKPHLPDYRARRPEFEFLFNSYYNSVGEQYPRPRRGLLSRPTVAEVHDYRKVVNSAMLRLLEREPLPDGVLELIELGLNHEQQHQELILMDIKHVFSCNPLHPVYAPGAASPREGSTAPLDWRRYPEATCTVGHKGPGFAFDNERPAHRVLVPGFELASRPVTNGEFLQFVEAGGYRSPEFWLADGWSRVGEERWSAPLYWLRRDEGWFEFTLGGLRPLDLRAPVCHVSYYEADAFAAWMGARLPTEAEWERAAAGRPLRGNLLEDRRFHPAPCETSPDAPDDEGGPFQIYGDVWEWTRSAYAPYPGFRKAVGAVGEYNGKFMCNQYVLRGGCCATPRTHIRSTYRNFFYPHCRWQFSGIRLARD